MLRSYRFFRRASGDQRTVPARQPHRSWLLLALPLVALIALLSAQAPAFAGGGGATVSITPSSGPVGTHVVVTGAHLTPGAPIQVGFSTGSCSSGVTIIGDGGTVGSDGSVTVPVTWPQTGTGSYTLCVIEKTTGRTHASDGPFQVLSAQAADITISQPVKSSEQVTVKGTNFLPGNDSVEVLYGPAGSNGCAQSAATTTTAADGSFTVTFNAPFESADTPIVITAVEPKLTCGASAVQQVSKTATVLAAVVAVTPTATPKATATPTASNPSVLGVFPVGGIFPVIYCLVGLLLLLLLLLALLVVQRQRRKDEPVTIQERDTVLVGAGGPSGSGGQASQAGAAPAVRRDIYAVDPRGRQTRIAEEVTTVEEEVMPPLRISHGPRLGGPSQPQGGGGGAPDGRFGSRMSQPPRFGPPLNPR